MGSWKRCRKSLDTGLDSALKVVRNKEASNDFTPLELAKNRIQGHERWKADVSPTSLLCIWYNLKIKPYFEHVHFFHIHIFHMRVISVRTWLLLIFNGDGLVGLVSQY